MENYKEKIMLKDGKNLYQIVSSPLKLTFHPKDILQIIIGATILAVPVAFTEETWTLGEKLPISNILWIMAISLIFISAFIYYNYYRNSLKGNWNNFIKRAFFTYTLAFIVVGFLLILIQKGPFNTSWLIAFKRIVIVTLPASMSAAIADMIK